MFVINRRKRILDTWIYNWHFESMYTTKWNIKEVTFLCTQALQSFWVVLFCIDSQGFLIVIDVWCVISLLLSFCTIHSTDGYWNFVWRLNVFVNGWIAYILRFYKSWIPSIPECLCVIIYSSVLHKQSYSIQMMILLVLNVKCSFMNYTP